jgi:hypothetical protein
VCLLGLAAASILVAPPVASGQSSNTCDEGRPFTARKAEHLVSEQPDGSNIAQEFGGLSARDSSGRIYSELHMIQTEPPPKKLQDTRESSIHFGHPDKSRINSTIWISDCHNRKDITVFPDLKIARTSDNNNASSRKRKNGASLFAFLTSGPRPPNVVFEDLGLKDVEGVLTHGYRSTILGTQDDGEWNGRVRYIDETWISDDLSEIILQILTNVRGKTETRITLTDIKREEPDASLFEIPAGYKIDPAPEN